MCSIVWEMGLFFFNLSMQKGWTFLEKQCRTFLSNCFQICTSRLAANMLCLPATVTIICIFLVKWKYVLIVLNDLINASSSCRCQLIWNLWRLLLILVTSFRFWWKIKWFSVLKKFCLWEKNLIEGLYEVLRVSASPDALLTVYL